LEGGWMKGKKKRKKGGEGLKEKDGGSGGRV